MSGNKDSLIQVLCYKTNKPSSSVLRSEKKHLASAESTQVVWKNARLRLAFLPTLLSCSRHLLRALFLNGARLKLVYLLLKARILSTSSYI